MFSGISSFYPHRSIIKHSLHKIINGLFIGLRTFSRNSRFPVDTFHKFVLHYSHLEVGIRNLKQSHWCLWLLRCYENQNIIPYILFIYLIFVHEA